MQSVVDPEQLKIGIKIEMEHTDNPKIAEKIARDHLAEIADYYTRLVKMEKEAIDVKNVKTYSVDILPRSDGRFAAWDPVMQKRIYKKGTITAESWPTEQEAKAAGIKFLKKKYPDLEFK
jgi:hypothetical protein